MFESRIDQAFGLRKLFGRRDVRVLPVAGPERSADHIAFVVNLAAALARLGRRPIILDGIGGLIAPTLGLKARGDLLHVLLRECSFAQAAVESRDGFWVMPAARGFSEVIRAGENPEAVFAGFAGLEPAFDTVLLSASPENVGMLLPHAEQETTLVCGADPRSLADTYAGIKALSTVHGRTNFRVIYHRAASASAAATCHERLSAIAERFLRVNIEFGGVISDDGAFDLAERAQSSLFSVAADSDAAHAFERIAASSLDWPMAQFGRTTESATKALH